jgi:hypothetical protein
MARYNVTRGYGNSQFFANKGDVVEIDDAEAARLEADSPGTFVRVEEQATSDAVEAGLLTETGAAVKEELEAQIPTVDLDVEDKAKEIPGEGNKYTPASGYQVPDSGVRVVERANTSNRQVTGASKRSDEVAPADTSASARVTDSTPASEAADAAQLADGVTAQNDDGEDAKAKKAAAAKTSKKG